MKNHIKIFSEHVLSENQSIRFKQVIYVYLVLRACFWLHQYELLFGEHALVYSAFKGLGNFKDCAFILLNSTSSHLAFYFLAALILVCFTALFVKKLRLLFDLLIWIIVINLHYKIYASLTGGDYLINQLLIFNLFLGIPTLFINQPLKTIAIVLHNTAVLAIMVQVCFVYFLSGLAKIIDVDWLQGRALIMVAQVDQFSLITTPHQNAFSLAGLVVLNYLILSYQVLFPILVFIKKIKKPILSFGIAMHVYIIVFMGLLWFGSIMIITYLFFWPFEQKKGK